jgi:hypothetical protein
LICVIFSYVLFRDEDRTSVPSCGPDAFFGAGATASMSRDVCRKSGTREAF